MRLLRKASLGYLGRHRGQLAMAVLGIALGVAVFTGVEIANRHAHASFAASTEIVAGRATHHIVSPGGVVDERVYVRLRNAYGALAAAPVIEGRLWLGEPAQAIVLLGVDPFAEGPFRSYATTAGGAAADLPMLVTEPGAVLATPELAGELGLGIGDTLRLPDARSDVLSAEFAGDQAAVPAAIRLAGFLTLGASRKRLAADLMVADIATAQELLGMQGQITRIDLSLAPGQAADLAGADFNGAEIVPAAASGRALTEMTRAFSINLTALSLLALVVGMFLIYATMSFMVVRRRAVTGMLRAIGTSRRQLFALNLSEALALGLAGSLAGLAGGWLLGEGLSQLVLRTVEDLYGEVSATATGVQPLALLSGGLIGVAGTVMAALVPAWEAATTPPRAVLNRASLERRARARLPWLAAAALGMLVLGGTLFLIAPRSLYAAFAGLFAVICAAALLAPAATSGLLRAAAHLLGRCAGMSGRLAARQAQGSLSRTGVAVAALTVAVATVIGIGVMIGSFRSSVADWLDESLKADFYLSPEPAVRGTGRPVLPAGLAAELRAWPEVARLREMRRRRVPDTAAGLRLWALGIEHEDWSFRIVAGDRAHARDAFFAGTAVLVSEPLARRRGLEPGGTLRVPTPEGHRNFPVAGVFLDYSSDLGVVAMHRDLYQRIWGDTTLDGLGVTAKDQPPPTRLRARLEALAARHDGIRVTASGEIRAISMAVFDRTFTITSVLRVLAGIVAFLGILSALAALQLERLRETAILRALGLTPAQARAQIVAQTSLLGAAAGLLAIPLGIVLAWLLVFVINRRAFGWSMSFEVDPLTLAQGFLLAIVAAVLAGVYPAWRMARSSPAGDLREE